MGKPSRFRGNLYIKYNKEANKSTCLIQNCGRELSGCRPANIARHYRLVHKINIYDSKAAESKKLLNNKDTNMSKNQFLKCCIGLVCVTNMPYEIFDDNEFFKRIIAPYEIAFNLNLKSTNIGSFVERENKKIKDIIKQRIYKKMISLKMDIANRMNKTFLAINIQYIKDFKLCMNTIGMIELNKNYTNELLIYGIEKCLQEYDIKSSQIYSKSIDNGERTISTSNLFEEKEIVCDEGIPSEIVVTHLLQVAAHDVIEVLDTQINECRNVVKELQNTIQTTDAPIPVLDTVKIWKTTYDMIKSLLSFKEYIVEMNIIIDWTFIENFIDAFQHLETCQLASQKELYILGDFYRDWLCCELELEDLIVINRCASLLYESMTIQKQKLLQNGAFVAALYLDPRFNFDSSCLISENHRDIGLRHLLKTNNMIESLEDLPKTKHNELNTLNFNTTVAAGTFDRNDQFSKLNQRIVEKSVKSKSNQTTNSSLRQTLVMLCNNKFVGLHTNVLEYWEQCHINYPELRKLFDVILAIPATQISIEYAFNALSTILTMQKSDKLTDDLSNLLLTKLNYNLLSTYTDSVNQHGDLKND